MYSYNRVHIIGYQTQPVEIRQTPGGTSVTDLNLVVPYAFKSESGEHMTGKSFHTVTLWGAMADIAGQYVRAGSQLFIGGRLQTDTWEDEQSKEKRSKTKIVGLDMIMLDPKDGQLPAPESAALLDGVNRAEVVGNVTRDPEVRTTTSGQHVVTIGVATNDRWKDRATGEDKERSEFHNVVLWGELAKQAGQQIKKGSRVYVSGRVQTRSWETQAGAKRYTTEIIADQCTLLGTANPTVAESINTSGAPISRRPAKQETAHDQEPVAAAMPAVQYESEVKVEDLPF
jgi:single-strand DNA-binding protein